MCEDEIARQKDKFQMVNAIRLTVVISLTLFLGGCSIKHVVSEDYHQYLINNEGSYPYPQTTYEAEYQLTPNTVHHSYEFRAATTGYANVWIVNFGEILEKTLQSKDLQNAFKTLSKFDNGPDSGKFIIKYNLDDYRFEGFEAQVTLHISVIQDGKVTFKKTYLETGTSQGGKMFWGGPFAMKNAIQQSTKNAIDKILAKSLHDMMSQKIH